MRRENGGVVIGPPRPANVRISPDGSRAAFTLARFEGPDVVDAALLVLDLRSEQLTTLLRRTRPPRTDRSTPDAAGQTGANRRPDGVDRDLIRVVDWLDDGRILAYSRAELSPGAHAVGERFAAGVEVLDARSGTSLAFIPFPPQLRSAADAVPLPGGHATLVRNPPGDLWEVRFDGGTAGWRRVAAVQTEHKYSWLTVLPEARHFTYLGRDGAYVGEVASGAIRKIEVGGSAGYPQPSPDGGRLAIAVATPGSAAVVSQFESATSIDGDRVHVIDPEGKSTAELRSRNGEELFRLGSWSPDGSRVLLFSVRRTGCVAEGMAAHPETRVKEINVWRPGAQVQPVRTVIDALHVTAQFVAPGQVLVTEYPYQPLLPLDQPTEACRQRARALAERRQAESAGRGPPQGVNSHLVDLQTGRVSALPAGLTPVYQPRGWEDVGGHGVTALRDDERRLHLLRADGTLRALCPDRRVGLVLAHRGHLLIELEPTGVVNAFRGPTPAELWIAEPRTLARFVR